jgi:uncharacterized protein YggE
MKILAALALALVLAAALGGSACANPAAAQSGAPPPAAAAPAPRTITVSADGKVSVKPDVAIVQTGVRLTAKTAEGASAEANARMKTLLDELRRLGVAEQDVQTSQFTLTAERPWENGRQLPVTGYTAASTVTVKVRALDKLPALLGRLPAVGANEVDSVQFGKDELGAVRDEALALAVGAARARAAAVARAAGVTLGEILSIDVQPGARPMPMGANVMMAKAAMGDSSEAAVATGELEITAGVHVVFAIR